MREPHARQCNYLPTAGHVRSETLAQETHSVTSSTAPASARSCLFPAGVMIALRRESPKSGSRHFNASGSPREPAADVTDRPAFTAGFCAATGGSGGCCLKRWVFRFEGKRSANQVVNLN